MSESSLRTAGSAGPPARNGLHGAMRRRGDWNHYTYVYGEGRLAEVEFDVAAALLPDPGRWPHGLRVHLDDADETAVLAALEGADGVLVGRLRYAGRIELVVQVVDPAGVGPIAGARIERTPGWDYFQDRVSPSPADWRRIEDRETIARLGLAPAGAVRTVHRFYGERAALDRVRERLAPEGFEPLAEDDRHLALVRLQPIEGISLITVGLLRLCEHAGVAYEGWTVG